MFPARRMRRLRAHPRVRDLVAEASWSPRDLVQPLFVDASLQAPREVASMPGVFRFPVDRVAKEATHLEDLGLPAVLLFGVPAERDATGSGAWDPDGVVQRAVRAVKEVTDLAVLTDLCLCQYTDHGHCGLLRGEALDNDGTVEAYGRVAVSQAKAGADVVAPSGMMDGQVAEIRKALDEAGFPELPLLSYAVKYASAFYGPFRDAADSAPSFGDRRSHQMDPATARQALLEAETDLQEGADVLMVKPGLPYLDVLRTLRDRFAVPLAAYQVSGEYAMIKAAALKGWLDEGAAVDESLTALRRAGADFLVTYFAKDAARRRRGGG